MPDPDPKDLLAAERTLLAWLRTGIALMGLGFVVARFGLFLRELTQVSGEPLAPPMNSAPLGLLLVGAGVAINFWTSVRYRTLVRRLKQGLRDVSPTGPFAVGVATCLGGLALVVLLWEALR